MKYNKITIAKMTERSLRLVGVVAPTPRRATSTNIQFSIFNSQFLIVRIRVYSKEKH